MLLLGHCMREISNRLPGILNPDLPERSMQDKAVQTLASAYRVADVKIEASSDSAAEAIVSVPYHVAVHVESVVTAHEAGGTANYAKAAFLVTGDVPDNLSHAAKDPDPAVSAFLKAKRYFMDRTHTGSKARKKPDDAEFEEHIAHFEHVLDIRLGDWWEARRKIQQILGLANAPLTDVRHTQAPPGFPTQNAEAKTINE